MKRTDKPMRRMMDMDKVDEEGESEMRMRGLRMIRCMG
jgi:hypothetical protein